MPGERPWIISFVFLIAVMSSQLQAQDKPDLSKLVDISTPHVRAHGDTDENIEKGKEILQRAVERLGYEKWETYRTLEINATDIWAKPDRWWPGKDQRFQAQYLLGTFTSRVIPVDGPWKGTVLGVQSWQGYKGKAPGSPIVKSSDPLLLFYLPSMQYFNELPFRLLSARFVTYAGEGNHAGKVYDLVYSTWGKLEANPDFDQFVMWIDRETKIVRMCHYTVRQAFPAAAGTIYFDSYKTVQGVTLPMKHFVLLEWPEEIKFPLDQNFFHKMEIHEARFGAINAGWLLPIEGLPQPKDWKPDTPIDWEAR